MTTTVTKITEIGTSEIAPITAVPHDEVILKLRRVSDVIEVHPMTIATFLDQPSIMVTHFRAVARGECVWVGLSCYVASDFATVHAAAASLLRPVRQAGREWCVLGVVCLLFVAAAWAVQFAAGRWQFASAFTSAALAWISAWCFAVFLSERK